MKTTQQVDELWEEIKLPLGHDGRVWKLHFPWNQMKTPHRHDLFEVNLIKTGRGTYLVENRKVDLVPGTLIWLRPEQSHLLVDADKSFSMDIWVFEKEMMMDFLDEHHFLFNSQPEVLQVNRLSPKRTEWLAHMSESFSDSQPTKANNAVIHFALLEFLKDTANSSGEGGKVHPNLHKVMDLLQNGDLSLDVLSKKVDCHPTWLSRQFKAQLGLSLTEYRQDLKLQTFMSLNQDHPNRTLLSLALEAGFGSYAQFHRVCKNRLGIEPKSLVR